MELHELALAEAAQSIRTKQVSPLELTEAVLARLDEVEPTVSAFATVTADLAVATAKTLTDEIALGTYRGPLHGVPVGVKDLYDTAGIPTMAGSQVLADHVPTTDSAVTAKLSTLGAVMIGKTHTHEFAYGSLTPASRNPWNPERTAGGSSGGSAAALASGTIMVGLGTDTGGSIRTPASVCGVVGLKPTYGRVSRRGIFPLSWSLDHAGPLTRTVEDAAIVLSHIAGHDPEDPASADVAVPDYTASLKGDLTGLTIGVPVNYFTEHVDPEVMSITETAIAAMVSAGAHVRPLTIPLASALEPTEISLLAPEASAVHQYLLRERADRYGEEVRTLLEAGELVPATDYIRALRARTRIQHEIRDMFADIDVLIAPSLPTPAVRLDGPVIRWPDGFVEPATAAYVRFAALGNVTGLPALSVPAGFTTAGLPVGIQIIGRPFEEGTILNVGYSYEALTSWSRLAPL
ncbi:amidase [Rhodococcus opacus]|nr:amidase [Rhodococcus opacus]